MADAAPVAVAPGECTHRTGEPGCDLVTCYGMPTDDQVESAVVNPLTPAETPEVGEYGACVALRELRAQLRRAVPDADVSMPTRRDSRWAYVNACRELHRIDVTVAGRAVTVVAYQSRGPLTARDWHYAVTMDGCLVTGDVDFQRHSDVWWRIAITVRDHIAETATDADRDRDAIVLTKAHAVTWALGRWPAEVALAYGDWYITNGNGDPDADHSAHVAAFHQARPDMIDADGRAVEPAPDDAAPVAVVEPAPVAVVEPAPGVWHGTDPVTGELTTRVVEPAPDDAAPVAVVEPAPLPGFTVPRAALADALAYLAPVAARVAVPVLAGVVLDATPDGTVTLSTFNYEQHRSYRITGASVATTGTGLVVCCTLADMVKAFPKSVDRITVAANGDRLTVAGGTRRYAVPTLPIEDYPTLPDAAPHVGRVGLAPFVDAVTRVAVAAGRDDTLPVLTGIRIEATGRTLSLTATDRYRLTLADVPWKPMTPDTEPFGMLPVARDLVAVVKVFGKAAGKTTGDSLAIGATPAIQAGKDATVGMLSLAWGPYRLTTRCLDGEFPEVRALLPDGYGARATVTATALKETVTGVAVVAERSTPVRLTVDTTTVRLAAGGSDGASADDEIPCTVVTGEFKGEKGKRSTLPPGFTVAFNHQYLLDGIGVVGSPELTLSVTDPRKPVVLDAVDPAGVAVTYLIMPVRIGGGAPVAPVPSEAAPATEPEPAPEPVAVVESAPVAEPAPVATVPAEPVAPVTAEQEGSAMPSDIPAPVESTPAADPVIVPAYERAALDARRLFDAGRHGDALETLATVPDTYRLAGKHPVTAIRAHITRAAIAAGRLDPAPVGPAPEPVAPVAVVEPAPAEPAPVADVVTRALALTEGDRVAVSGMDGNGYPVQRRGYVKATPANAGHRGVRIMLADRVDGSGRPVYVRDGSSVRTLDAEPVEPAPVAEPGNGATVVAETSYGQPVIVAEVSRVDLDAPVAVVDPEPAPVAVVEPAAVLSVPLTPGYGRAINRPTRVSERTQPVTVVGPVSFEPSMVRVRTADGTVIRAAREHVTMVDPAPDTDTDTAFRHADSRAYAQTLASAVLAGRPVEPAAPAVADPADVVAVGMAESAAVATLAAEPVAVDPGDTPLYPTYTLPGFALLSAGGSSYRNERRNVRKALHAARYGRFTDLDPATGERVAAILANVVCHVEAVDGAPARFTVEFALPAGADPAVVRGAVDQVVTAATVTVVDSIPAM